MEFSGKTVEEAIQEGLNYFGLSQEQVEIEIINQPTKGLFGKLKGKATVNMEKKLTGEERARDFVQKIVDMMDMTVKATLNEDDNGKTTITLIAESSSEVIGHRGEVLDALQTLAGAVANIDKKEYKKIFVDCENYRNRREETLIALAHKLEDKATEMRREVILEPMSPFERRIIHTALAESKTVTTKSEGKDPNRYVVVVPFDKDENSTPYNAGRNSEKRSGRKDGFRGDKKGGNRKNRGFKDRKKEASGEKRKTPSIFGTYLGNSLKND